MRSNNARVVLHSAAGGSRRRGIAFRVSVRHHPRTAQKSIITCRCWAYSNVLVSRCAHVRAGLGLDGNSLILLRLLLWRELRSRRTQRLTPEHTRTEAWAEESPCCQSVKRAH